MATTLPRLPRSTSKLSTSSAASVPLLVLGHHTNPLVTLGFEGARHHVPERLPSARKDRMVGIKVIEFSEETKDSIVKAAATLRRLDLSNLGLTEIPEDVTHDLTCLERLDVSNNHLTEDGFPANLQHIETLIELNAHNNSLMELPKCVRKLKHLSRLKLGKNKIKTMAGVEKLKRLTMLVIDDNDIENFSKDFYQNLKRIEVLHCARNNVRELSIDIRLFRQLREIDMSDNSMTFLPAELFLLPKLASLNASNNQIARLPTIVIKGKSTTRLSSIDLSGNVLVKFPDHLLLMCDSLDLSRNKIKTIPGKSLKKMDWHTTQELILDDNPLTNPPVDVCECGIRSVIQYFQEAKTEMKVYQGVKVLVTGQYRAGKTSMVQTLVDLQGRLTDDEDRTSGIDTYETALDLDGPEEGALARQLQLTIWDFAGNQDYLYSHFIFLHQPALSIVVFNMAEYNPKEFHNQIYQQVLAMITKSNTINLIVVGTHSDKIRKRRVPEICKDVEDKLAAANKRFVQSIEREIKKIESKPHISPALSEQLKSYISLLKVKMNVYDKVIPFSAATMGGLTELNGAIIAMSTNTSYFPNVMRSIPSLWAEVENYVDEKGYTMPIPLVSWSDYMAEITKRFGMKHLIDQITRYLHETGKVLWYDEHPALKHYVILRPNWLMDLMKQLFRREYGDLESMGHEEQVKVLQLNQAKLDQMKEEYNREGIICRDLLRLTWANLVPMDSTKSLMEVVRFLVEQFEVGYVVDRPNPDGRLLVLSRAVDKNDDNESEKDSGLPGSRPMSMMSFDNRPVSVLGFDGSRPPSMMGIDRPDSVSSSVRPLPSLAPSSSPKGGMVPGKFNNLLIPWMREVKLPSNFREEYEQYVASPSLVANFRFPSYIPAGLFETICTRAATRYNLDTLYHWGSGMYARHIGEIPCRFYLLRINHDDRSTCVRTEIRHERYYDVNDVENLWQVLLPFLRGFDALIGTFSGVRVERNMECPSCHSLAFLGEWQTPKELQNLPSKVCDNCKTEISTAFLVQPKEKKKVEEFLRQRLLSSKTGAPSTVAEEQELEFDGDDDGTAYSETVFTELNFSEAGANCC